MNFEYFETDQIKFAVRLWRAVKKSSGVEFDVLKFTHDWGYAETVLASALTSDDETASAIAIEIVQMRTQFLNHEPARARKLGAQIGSQDQPMVSSPSPAASAAPAAPAEKDAKPEAPPPSQYVKTLR